MRDVEQIWRDWTLTDGWARYVARRVRVVAQQIAREEARLARWFADRPHA